LYLLGLDLTTPAIAQVIIQNAVVLLAVGGIWFFGESFNRFQWAGFVALVAGLGIFFHRQLAAFSSDAERLWQGGLFVFAAGAAWSVYALLQKQLLIRHSSARIMLFIYGFATLVLLPTTSPSGLVQLGLVAWLVVAYCAVNTLIAYGAFAEALNHWEASRVSVVLALTPLGTIAFEKFLERFYPGTTLPERLDGISMAGAALVVAASMATSLAGNRARTR